MVPRAKCVINCNYCITQKGQKCNNRARVTLIAFCSLFTSKDCSAVGLYTLVKNCFCEFLPQLLAMCDPWVFLKRERRRKKRKKRKEKAIIQLRSRPGVRIGCQQNCACILCWRWLQELGVWSSEVYMNGVCVGGGGEESSRHCRYIVV